MAVWLEMTRAIVMAIHKPLLWGEQAPQQMADYLETAFNNISRVGEVRHVASGRTRRRPEPQNEEDDPLA